MKSLLPSCDNRLDLYINSIEDIIYILYETSLLEIKDKLRFKTIIPPHEKLIDILII